MSKLTVLATSLALALTGFSCGAPAPPSDFVDLVNIPLLPLPVEVTQTEGYLLTDEEPEVTVSAPEAELTGLNPGWYRLEITPEGIDLITGDEEGELNGLQTLEQITHFATARDGKKFLPAGVILDEPRYAYRGFMLDVARHFFGPDSVKAVIDRLADYKINHLHLHLSDDQGWRIEIKSWPELTKIGAATEVDGTPGGFYTQDEYRDLVTYAAARGVTVVPEIDMPGHTNAALSAYAELNADGVAREPYVGTKVGFSTFATRKEVTYKFIDDVVREIAAMTPGPYFHLGGDESDATDHEDYVYFVNEVQKIVSSHGKKPVGWDEIATATLAPEAVVQLWAHPDYAAKAIQAGNQVLMSPATKTYLDMQYDSTSRIGLHWAAYIEVDSAYLWDPTALVPGAKDSDILGIEAPLWAETVRTPEDIEYLVFPRLLALAEVGWTPQPRRDWESFKKRLAAHQAWLKEEGVATYDTKVLR